MPPRLTLAAAALADMTCPSLAAGCHVDPFRTIFGADTDSRMTLKTGSTCGITMRMGERLRTANFGGSGQGIVLSQQAQHGTVTVTSQDHLVYAPARGFTGQDRFVFEQTGETMGGNGKFPHRGTSHYTINVDVTP